ncbi:MAG: MBL fold metallo-hydrolase, partial [Alistipes sp.]|nr:MBL fold metallo-hydrolase [Alistipes sp.]
TTGFRIGKLAYLTDFKLLEEEELQKLTGVEVLVVNALRPEPHDSHWNLEEALAIIGRIGPRRAFLTHCSHEMGLHAERQALLPQGVELAYDELTIEI